MWEKIKAQAKRYLIEGLLIALIGTILYGILTIKVNNENFQLSVQTQDQRQWQQTIIISDKVFTSLKFQTQIITDEESCGIKKEFFSKDDYNIKFLGCVAKVCSSKDFGCSNISVLSTHSKFYALITYYVVK